VDCAVRIVANGLVDHAVAAASCLYASKICFAGSVAVIATYAVRTHSCHSAAGLAHRAATARRAALTLVERFEIAVMQPWHGESRGKNALGKQRPLKDGTGCAEFADGALPTTTCRYATATAALQQADEVIE